MTKEQLLAMAETEYMSAPQAQYFEAVLRGQAEQVNQSIANARERLANLGVAADDLDKAAIEEERQALARALERLNAQYLDIRQALGRIADGEYGWCESTGEAIGLARLIAHPCARLSAVAQSVHEQRSRHFAAA